MSGPEIPNYLEDIRDELQGLDQNTDEVEAKLDSVIAELQDIEVDVENVDVNTDEVESELQDVNTELDSIDGLLDELDDALFSTTDEDELRVRYIDLRGEVGELNQADFDSQIDATLPANGELVSEVRAPGGDSINGQAKSSGQYSILVRWRDFDGDLIREEGVASNRNGGEWSNFRLDPKNPFADIVVAEDSGTDQTATISTHFR